jgi:hypothetical protein
MHNRLACVGGLHLRVSLLITVEFSADTLGGQVCRWYGKRQRERKPNRFLKKDDCPFIQRCSAFANEINVCDDRRVVTGNRTRAIGSRREHEPQF